MPDKKQKTSLPFIRAYDFLLEKKDLKPAEKLVLIILCRFWPSPFWGANSSIANIVNISRRQTINIINSLKTKGLIKSGYAHRNRDGRNHTVRVIVPLCLEGKCRLPGETDFTLIERSRKRIERTRSLPLPALGQAKTLTENELRQRLRKQIAVLRNAS